MHKLLTDDTFDSFQVTSASVTTFCTFEVDGRYQADYDAQPDLKDQTDAEENGRTYAQWGRIRSFFYELIRGKQAPSRMTLTFRLPDAGAAKLLQRAGTQIQETDIGGLYLHIRFQEGQVTCVTGLSLNVFTLDKRLEHEWDDGVAAFLRKNEIPFTQV